MKIKTFLLTLIVVSFAGAQKKDLPFRMQKSTATQWKIFDGNTISSAISNDGPFCDYRMTGSSGLTWPKGSSKTAVFTSGLVIIGKHQPTGSFRTASQNYMTEFQPGPILSTYNTATNDVSVAANANDTTFRIYKINKNDNAATNSDYAKWPGQLGAPYNDVNTNGQWDQGIDTPKLFGHQMLWNVYNDLDTADRKIIGKTKPMGLEVHAMFYGFDKSGAMGNTMFMKWKIINKSDAQYDSLFIGIFSDTEMGDANDDLVAYDTSLQLSYVYNGDDSDAGGNGYGTTPPACGYLFLHGNPQTDLYAHPYIFKHSAEGFIDLPIGESYDFVSIVNNLVRARNQTTGAPTLNPITNQPSRYTLSGDPVTNTGWLSPIAKSDVRHFISIGPVSLAPGATQEINAAFVIAQSTDRLQSVTLLKQYAGEIRSIVASDPNFATSVGSFNDGHIPNIFVLEQNYPNPFNPSTTIHYSVPTRSNVALSVFNVLGQHVTTLTNDVHDAGNYSVVWNGKDSFGKSVASGLYFYQLTSVDFSSIKKMVLIK